MANTVRQLAELVRGTVVGDADLVILSARTLDEAQSDDIAFIEKPHYVARLQASKARAAVVPLDLSPAIVHCGDVAPIGWNATSIPSSAAKSLRTDDMTWPLSAY